MSTIEQYEAYLQARSILAERRQLACAEERGFGFAWGMLNRAIGYIDQQMREGCQDEEGS